MDFRINGNVIKPGQHLTLDLPITKLYTHTPVAIPVHVIRGKQDGPRLFVCAAIHGDELNGVEVVRRLLQQSVLKGLHGTLVAIPIVNVHGFLYHSRYLPDRRDLNRSFPGSEEGSLAARLANLFMKEIVLQCHYGIDIHTGAFQRSNLPQIRANLDDPETATLASAFGVPVILNSNLRDGSLREAAAENGIPMLLYEGGEALRFDEVSIRAGVRGVINVMRELGMITAKKRTAKTPTKKIVPLVARSSHWVRAPASGVVRNITALGARVSKDEVLGSIADPFGEKQEDIIAPFDGIVIGRSTLPLANEGDALIHIARFSRVADAEEQLEGFRESLGPALLREDTTI